MSQPSQNNSKTELSCLDPGQIAKDTHIPKDNAIKTVQANCLVPNEFAKVAITYVTSGNGIGEIETATYYDPGIKQVSRVTPIGDQQPETEITKFIFTNDLNPAGLAEKYLTMNDSTGSVGIYFALDGSIVVPMMGTDRSIKVDILSSDTINDIASKFRAAVNADSEYVATVMTQIVLVTHVTQGQQIDAQDVNTGITVSIQTQGQEAKLLNNTYFFIYSPSGKYYVWYNVNGAGVDPAPGGTIGSIEVAISENATNLEVLNNSVTAINNSIYFSATSQYNSIKESSILVITCDQAGPTSNIEDFNTGFGHFITDTTGEDKKVIRTLVCTYDSNDELIEVDSF